MHHRCSSAMPDANHVAADRRMIETTKTSESTSQRQIEQPCRHRERRITPPDVVEAGEHARLESAHVAEKHTLQPELLLECCPNRQALDVKILRMESVRVESARDPAVDST